MSWISAYLRKQKEKKFRRSFDPAHHLRRHLALHLEKDKFEIGDYSYGEPMISLWGPGCRLKVGKYCSIAQGAHFILGGNHPLDQVTTFPLSRATGKSADEGPFSRGDVVVGSDVWIGSKATILSGVTIGDGAIVGACAVVASHVPPYAVVVGNPARVVRKRFSEAVIARLLDLRWWDLADDQIRALQPLLQSVNIEEFMTACEQFRPERMVA